MTFFPHPRQIVNEEHTLKYITPLQRKARKMEELGVDQLIVVKFDSAFASLPSSDFIKQYLLGFQCKHAVAGFDFHYGHKGKGDIASLKVEGKGHFEVSEIKKIEIADEKVSSTMVRKLISEGRIDEVPTYLGTCYESDDENPRWLRVRSKQFGKAGGGPAADQGGPPYSCRLSTVPRQKSQRMDRQDKTSRIMASLCGVLERLNLS